jgi:hypothetical protein
MADGDLFEVLVKPMSVSPRFVDPTQPARSRKSAAASRQTKGKAQRSQRMPLVNSQPQSIGTRSRNQGRQVENLPSAPITPVWLRSLLMVQRGSSVVTFCLITATLAVYAWTVYTQQTWAREYSKLENLQRNERQITAANEVLKNQLAQQAERPGTGLVPPTPDKTIFLPPAPQRQSKVTSSAAIAISEPATKTPLGY